MCVIHWLKNWNINSLSVWGNFIIWIWADSFLNSSVFLFFFFCWAHHIFDTKFFEILYLCPSYKHQIKQTEFYLPEKKCNVRLDEFSRQIITQPMCPYNRKFTSERMIRSKRSAMGNGSNLQVQQRDKETH